MTPPRSRTLLLAICLIVATSVVAQAAPIQWTVGSGGNGHWYNVVSAPGGISWTGANAAAIASGGYLATITSATENAFIYDSLVNNPLYWSQEPGGSDLGPWLGGYQTSDNGSQASLNWTWVTAEAWSYTNWHSGEPNNFTGSLENYLSFKCAPTAGCRSGMWNDLPDNISVFGTAVIAYVVEWNSVSAVRTPGAAGLGLRALPNPFSGSTRISLTTPDAVAVAVGIFDVNGRRVREFMPASVGRTRDIEWDGKNDRGEPVPSGIYFCRVQTASRSVVGRLVLIR
jgi:hypothetical protein